MRRHHIHVELESLLANWKNSDWDQVCTDENGRPLSAREAKSLFQAIQDEGAKVYPCCLPHKCPEFDYTGGGCPGHHDEDGNKL